MHIQRHAHNVNGFYKENGKPLDLMLENSHSEH